MFTEDLKNAYGVLGAHPSFQRACRSIPIMATLDDNDYGNGQWRRCLWRKFQQRRCQTHVFRQFKVAKEDERWQANRGVYTSVSWQEEMQVLLLDLRYHESKFLETPDRKHLIISQLKDLSTKTCIKILVCETDVFNSVLPSIALLSRC
jgi:hypothetical protein